MDPKGIYTIEALKAAADAAEVSYVIDDEGSSREALEIDGSVALINVWPYAEGYLLTAYWTEGGYGMNPPEPMDREIETVTDPAEAIERAEHWSNEDERP